MEYDYIVIGLEGPMMSFGGPSVDNIGPTRRFPAASMLTGLLANAFGWHRTDHLLLDQLQATLSFACRSIEPAQPWLGRIADFQTALLSSSDAGWTTRGKPEGRSGSPDTYKSPLLRYREYLVDTSVTVAFRIRGQARQGHELSVDDVCRALVYPKRPLFIGRKSCIPGGQIFQQSLRSRSAVDALLECGIPHDGTRNLARLQWMADEGSPDIPAAQSQIITDQRNWKLGFHGGGRLVHEATISADLFPAAPIMTVAEVTAAA